MKKRSYAMVETDFWIHLRLPFGCIANRHVLGKTKCELTVNFLTQESHAPRSSSIRTDSVVNSCGQLIVGKCDHRSSSIPQS